jgi:hypothetical protein
MAWHFVWHFDKILKSRNFPSQTKYFTSIFICFVTAKIIIKFNYAFLIEIQHFLFRKLLFYLQFSKNQRELDENRVAYLNFLGRKFWPVCPDFIIVLYIYQSLKSSKTFQISYKIVSVLKQKAFKITVIRKLDLMHPKNTFLSNNNFRLWKMI